MQTEEQYRRLESSIHALEREYLQRRLDHAEGRRPLKACVTRAYRLALARQLRALQHLRSAN